LITRSVYVIDTAGQRLAHGPIPLDEAPAIARRIAE